MFVDNNILSLLPAPEKQALLPHLESVVLRKPQLICEPGQALEHVYFLTSGLVSLLSISEDGRLTEVAAVTRDGFIGPPILPPDNTSSFQIIVRISGRALRIRHRTLAEKRRGLVALQAALLKHTHDFVQSICAREACHYAHTPIQRLSNWLLVVQSVVGADHFELTQEAIALSLAVSRSVVTEAAIALHDAGAISYRHGQIVIRDRKGLVARACMCHRPEQNQDRVAASPCICAGRGPAFL